MEPNPFAGEMYQAGYKHGIYALYEHSQNKTVYDLNMATAGWLQATTSNAHEEFCMGNCMGLAEASRRMYNALAGKPSRYNWAKQ